MTGVSLSPGRTQGSLFDDLAPEKTVASPLCIAYFPPCKRKGRAVYGEEVSHDGCVNRSITCLTCGVTGEESRNTETE